MIAKKRGRPKKPIVLVEDQKLQVLLGLKNGKDLMQITRELFDDETLDGRSREGQAVRKCIASHNRKLMKESKVLTLSEEQKAYIMSDNVERGMTILEITRIVFKRADIASLSREHKLVTEFVKENRPDIMDEELTLAEEKYLPPNSFGRVMRKVNEYCSKNFDAVTIHAKQRKWIEGLQAHLKSPLFISSINQLKTVADRELFEGEFVRATWDKPDLTSSEINSYVMICANYIRIKQIQNRMNLLNSYLDDTHGDPQISMKLTELIKGTASELNDAEKRVGVMLKTLEGDRARRIEKRGQESGSILALVEAFQIEEERNKLVNMAEMKNKLVEEEVDRIESLDEWKARIMGISKVELT